MKMAVKGLISDTFMPDFEILLGHPLPNGLVVSGVLGWLHAANDSMNRNTYVKIMSDSFTDDEIDEAKKILVEIVLKNNGKENVKNNKDLVQWIKGRKNQIRRKSSLMTLSTYSPDWMVMVSTLNS